MLYLPCQKQTRQQPQKLEQDQAQGRQRGVSPHAGEIVAQQDASCRRQSGKSGDKPYRQQQLAAAQHRFSVGHEPVPIDQRIGGSPLPGLFQQGKAGLHIGVNGLGVYLEAAA